MGGGEMGVLTVGGWGVVVVVVVVVRTHLARLIHKVAASLKTTPSEALLHQEERGDEDEHNRTADDGPGLHQGPPEPSSD